MDVSLAHRYFSPSHPPSLPLSLKINKYNLGKEKSSTKEMGQKQCLCSVFWIRPTPSLWARTCDLNTDWG